LPSTLITLGRGWPGARNDLWKKRFAAAASWRAGSRKSIVAPVESTAPQVNPLALHPNVGLIHPPGAAGGLQLPAALFVQFGRVALNPTPDSGVVGGDAPLGEEFLDVPIGQGESQIPAHRTGNDGRFEVAPLEQGWPGFAHRIISGARTPPSQLCNTSRITDVALQVGGISVTRETRARAHRRQRKRGWLKSLQGSLAIAHRCTGPATLDDGKREFPA
jgi:hypothetical protein